MKRYQKQSSEQLKGKVYEVVADSPYEVKLLEVNDGCFGNVHLVLQNETSDVRFIQDRGDVYVERKAIDAVQWNECLFFSHNESDGQFYGLLLKAISVFLSGNVRPYGHCASQA